MTILKEFISTYGAALLYSIITAIAGYISIAIKRLFTKYVNDQSKRDVVKTCVNAVEQIYTDLHGQEKLDKCIESAASMLSEKGIAITELEIKMLIESAVNEINSAIRDAKNGSE